MIIVHIFAGMGNQMFMYAAGLSAASRLNTELCLDALETRVFSPQYHNPLRIRYYALSCFPNITERQASLREIWKLCPAQVVVDVAMSKPVRRWRYHPFRLLARQIAYQFHNRPSKTVYAPLNSNIYSTDFEKLHDNIYIRGYFGSEKFFANIKDIVRKKFKFAPDCFNPELASKIQSCNSVAIHIRRGDKVNNKGFLPSKEDYIRHSIEKISALTQNPKFFVFSDDINWCKINLPKIYSSDYTFIENQTPQQDMALMTICKHVIMGPSTFSWWGAWLNENPHKIIIAPDLNLYSPGVSVNDDFLPHSWIRLE